MNQLTVYFDKFGSRSCCFTDFSPYIDLLSEEKRNQVSYHIEYDFLYYTNWIYSYTHWIMIFYVLHKLNLLRLGISAESFSVHSECLQLHLFLSKELYINYILITKLCNVSVKKKLCTMSLWWSYFYNWLIHFLVHAASSRAYTWSTWRRLNIREGSCLAFKELYRHFTSHVVHLQISMIFILTFHPSC